MNKKILILWVFIVGVSVVIAGNLDKASGEFLMFFKPGAAGNIVRADASGKFYDGGTLSVVLAEAKAISTDVTTGTSDTKYITPKAIVDSANIANGFVRLASDAKLPVLDGSALTGITATGDTGAVANTLAQRDANAAITADTFYGSADKMTGTEWSLIQRVTVTASTASLSADGRYRELAGAQTSYTFDATNCSRWVDGDTARRYKLIYYHVNATGAGADADIVGRLNADSGANYTGILAFYYSGAAWTTMAYTSWIVGRYQSDTSKYTYSQSDIVATSGQRRPITLYQHHWDASMGWLNCTYSWSNTADNITSVSIHAPTGGIGVGAYIELYKLNN